MWEVKRLGGAYILRTRTGNFLQGVVISTAAYHQNPFAHSSFTKFRQFGVLCSALSAPYFPGNISRGLTRDAGFSPSVYWTVTLTCGQWPFP